ncbi:V-containing nitrogenase subunit delta [Candidatus Methylobacter oryzae]|uniref:nitrogenase n=1 Tax=Candidatus Methylobacter oryzae TaxID=2497749 RepID=A0ABY3C4Y9_9GAMM|nr:V-containing nitrogenase subunit delta [Candidatus Methylobacter oryzae]TRW89611.1 V-containing nitrogenase subunit delta [Candidatus Methylobacter oryzae]
MTITVSESKISDLFNYVQERCLWQFSSRTWDRQENIDGVLAKAADLMLGREPSRETPTEKLHCAEAKILVADCLERYPWVKDVLESDVNALMEGLKARLTDIAITNSHNRELNHRLY